MSSRQGVTVIPAARPAGAAPGDHVVQFYRDEEDLVDRVGGYLVRAVTDGAVALVIATPAHQAAFEARLADARIDVASARASGVWLTLDAEQILDQSTVGGSPDPAAFGRVIGALIEERVRQAQPVRAFDEMVALLWGSGLVTAAIEVEQLWNELSRGHPFSLWCAYPAQAGPGDAGPGSFSDVCQLHTAVIAGGPGFEAAPSAPGDGGVSRAFPLSLHAVTAARYFVTATLEGKGAGRLVADAAAVVTEFAANAVVHARSAFTVTLTELPGALRITVRDHAALPATGPSAGFSVEPVRGLGAVAAMAVRWGVKPAGEGKDVWAELPR
jgi:hypothetical protein